MDEESDTSIIRIDDFGGVPMNTSNIQNSAFNSDQNTYYMRREFDDDDNMTDNTFVSALKGYGSTNTSFEITPNRR